MFLFSITRDSSTTLNEHCPWYYQEGSYFVYRPRPTNCTQLHIQYKANSTLYINITLLSFVCVCGVPWKILTMLLSGLWSGKGVLTQEERKWISMDTVHFVSPSWDFDISRSLWVHNPCVQNISVSIFMST